MSDTFWLEIKKDAFSISCLSFATAVDVLLSIVTVTTDLTPVNITCASAKEMFVSNLGDNTVSVTANLTSSTLDAAICRQCQDLDDNRLPFLV